MKIYKLEIEEILQKIIVVGANTEQEAIEIIKEKYFKDEIELDYSDLKEVSVKNMKGDKKCMIY